MDDLMRKRSDPLLLIWGVFFTLAIHMGIVAVYLLWSETESQAVEPQQPPEWMRFEAVELLMWGEVMPNPHRLPIMPNPAPEERQQEVVAVDPTPQNPSEDAVALSVSDQEDPDRPTQRESRRREEPDQRRDSARHNPNRPINNEPLWGSPDGFRGGTSLSPTALANLFGPVQEQIQRAFRAPSSLSADDLRRLEGRVRVFVNREGRITHFAWDSRSGNSAFDAAAESALNRFRLGSDRLRLPFDNEVAMEQAVQRGFIVIIRSAGH
ncbi:MAG: TonB C-terminal domain-containing protein [Bradymonadales bacterium]|nr:TonB C-terminal domain-containing protein [Bradymonadales bacterium]